MQQAGRRNWARRAVPLYRTHLLTAGVGVLHAVLCFVGLGRDGGLDAGAAVLGVGAVHGVGTMQRERVAGARVPGQGLVAQLGGESGEVLWIPLSCVGDGDLVGGGAVPVLALKEERRCLPTGRKGCCRPRDVQDLSR